MIKMSLHEALFNRLIWAMLILIISSFGLVAFIGQVAITEQAQFQTGLMASWLRIASVVIQCIFVCNAVLREQQDKQLDWFLSLAIPRHTYYLAKLFSYGLVALVLSLMSTLALWLVSGTSSSLLWGISLLGEMMIMTSASIILCFSFRQLPPTLGLLFLFYLLCRSINALGLIASYRIDDTATLGDIVISKVMEVLSWFLPDLSRFSSSHWLISPPHADVLVYPLVQTLIYVVLLSAIGMLDLQRKAL
jgi:hypothetical protein|tara:strand:+ start:2531 stop:3277 length:747 start_codon:yes stop_codon:yes gene_type:complete